MIFARLLITSIVFAAGSVHALQIPKSNFGLNDVISVVEKPFQYDRSGRPQIENVRADFFQRSTIAAKQKEYRAEGEMYLQPASSLEALKFRFDYFRPTRQEVVCDGKTLWIYLPENRQVILSDVSEFFDPMRTGPANRGINFLQGLGRISKDFAILFNNPMNDAAGNYILELTPLRSSAAIRKLYITVNRESLLDIKGARPQTNMPQARLPEPHLFAILSTTVVDHDGNSTTMEFSNISTNGMMSDMLFNFMPPADAQVVRPPTGR